MPTETAQPANAELIQDAPQELQVVIQQNALQPDTAKSLQASFAPLFKQAREVIEKSHRIVVTDANQKLEMKLAKACRLELKGLRVAGEKTRKELKEESLRKGKAIDGFNAILVDLIVAEETRLQAQEEYVERQEETRRANMKAEREKVLASIQVDPNLYQLADMSEDTFRQLVEGTKLARAAEADRRRKEEAERIDREAKEAAERERIRLENEQLKKEREEQAAERKRREALHAEQLDRERVKAAREREAAEAAAQAERDRVAKERADAEAKAKAERDAAEAERKAEGERQAKLLREANEAARVAREASEAKAKAEREEHARKVRELEAASKKKAAEEKAVRDELERKLQAQRDADAKRKADEAEAARKAAAAPDRDKLLNYANAIRALEIPTLSTPEAQSIANLIAPSRDKFVHWIEEKAGAL